MRAIVRHYGKVSAVYLHGFLTTGGGDIILRKKVEGLLETGRKRIVVSLRRVGWMDSGGMAELIRCSKRADEIGATIKLLNPRGKAYDQLQLVKLTDYFEIHKHPRDAFASF